MDRLCCKNHLGYKSTEHYFSSGGNLEETLHESHLSSNVAFPESFNLALPNHVHDLIAADGPPRRVETEEAEPWIDSAFDESVILFDDIIDRKSTRLNSSHSQISYAVFCLKKKTIISIPSIP